MKFLDYIRFALKNIWRQKMRTILTIFAVIIGATSVSVMLALVFGAKNTMLNLITQSGALTQISVVGSTDTSNTDIFSSGNNDHTGKKLDDAFAAQLAAMNHVVGVTPESGVYMFNRVELKGGDGKTYRMNNVTAFTPNSHTDKDLAAGRNLTTADKEGKIILSADVAEQLGFGNNAQDLVGKTVMLSMNKGYTGEGADVPEMPNPQQFNGPMTDAQQQQAKQQQDAYQQQIQNLETILEAEVIGVTKPGFESGSYITMAWARGIMQYRNWQQDPEDAKRYQQEQQALNQGQHGPGYQPKQPAPVKMVLTGQDQIEQNGYDNILINVDDANNVEPLAAQIRDLKVGAITAKQTLDSILKVFNILSIVLGIIGGISLFVAAIGVVNTMVMAALERTREIGVMRATGATRATVRRLFTFEAALLGFWGGVFGVGVAYGLTKVASTIASQQDQFKGLGNANLVTVPLWLALGVIAITTIIGMVAGWYPALRASKMDPVEALRYE